MKGKQYSIWHNLPNTKTNFISILSRDLLKKDSPLKEFTINIDKPLLLFISHFLINNGNIKNNQIISIKRSKLRNFIGKKIHSEKKNLLDEKINSFLKKLKKMNEQIIYFYEDSNILNFQFSKNYIKKLVNGNTVSMNLYDLTSIRGEKAKSLFFQLYFYDMREQKRYSFLSQLTNLLGLNLASYRKTSIQTIKRAFISLNKKGFIIFNGYSESMSNIKNYKFKYILDSIHQTKI